MQTRGRILRTRGSLVRVPNTVYWKWSVRERGSEHKPYGPESYCVTETLCKLQSCRVGVYLRALLYECKSEKVLQEQGALKASNVRLQRVRCYKYAQPSGVE